MTNRILPGIAEDDADKNGGKNETLEMKKYDSARQKEETESAKIEMSNI